MILFYLQPSWSKQQPSCDVENGSYFRADFEAVAIKSSDAIVKKLVPDKPMKFVGWSPAVQEADTYFTIPLAERNKGAKDVLVDVCVEVRLSTHRKRQQVSRWHKQVNRRGYAKRRFQGWPRQGYGGKRTSLGRIAPCGCRARAAAHH